MKNPFSNAPEGFPDTYAGYPLFYPIGGDGKPVGKARLVFNGNTFTDVKEVLAYKKALEARDEAAENQAEYVKTDGKFEFDQLSDADWVFYANHPEVWKDVNGTASQFAGKLQEVFVKFGVEQDEASYAGIFKA